MILNKEKDILSHCIYFHQNHVFLLLDKHEKDLL